MSRVARRTTKLAATAAAVAIALTGCAGLRPGVAAKVGDESITTREVDDFAHGLCVYLAKSPSGPSASADARKLAVGVLVRSELANQYGRRTQLKPDQQNVEASLDSVAGAVTGLDDDERETFLDTVRESLEGEQYVTLAAQAALQSQGKEATDAAVSAEVLKLYTEWSKDADVELDPRFGTWENVDSKLVSGSLSVPVDADAAPDSKLPGAKTCS